MFLRIVYCAHLNVFLGKLVGWGLVQGDQGLAVDIACFCLYCTWGLGVGPKGAGGGHRICIWFVFLLYSDHVFVLHLSCICIFKVGWLGVGPEGAGGGHRLLLYPGSLTAPPTTLQSMSNLLKYSNTNTH